MTPTMIRMMLHAPRTALFMSCLGGVIITACRPAQPGNDTTAQRTQASAADSQSLVIPPPLGTVAAKPNTLQAGKQIGVRRPNVGETTSAGRANTTIPPIARRGDATVAETLTVAAFLDRSMTAGHRVQISGTCLDQFHTRGSAGPPPVSRSDWQLANGTQVVYVVGRMPSGCSAGSLTLTGTVGMDSTLVGGRRVPRRFLVISR
jgi:hypothetical protein